MRQKLKTDYIEFGIRETQVNSDNSKLYRFWDSLIFAMKAVVQSQVSPLGTHREESGAWSCPFRAL
jgi:hypothetical protein